MAFRLSPSGFPLYLCSLHFRLAYQKSDLGTSTSSVTSPRPRNSFPFPLAKDAAPIPNALEATSIELRAMSKVTEPVEVTNLCLRQAQAPFAQSSRLVTKKVQKPIALVQWLKKQYLLQIMLLYSVLFLQIFYLFQDSFFINRSIAFSSD